MKKIWIYIILLSLLLAFISNCTLTGIGIVKNRPPKSPRAVNPPNGATNVSLSPTLSWKAGDPDGDELTYDIYLGENDPPSIIERNLKESKYVASGLIPGTVYYWRVVAKDKYGIVTESSIYSFTTSYPPSEPHDPTPPDGAMNVSLSPTLSWKAEDPDGDELTYDIYFGENNPPPLVEENLKESKYAVSGLKQKTTYYWKVVAKDKYGIKAESPVWKFKTKFLYNLKWKFETGNYVYSSPAIGEDGTIYVGSWDDYLYAINPDGTLKWKFKTSNWIDSSPAIGQDGTIYVGSEDHYLYAINPDGSLKWKFKTGSGVNSSPAIGQDGTIYVGSYDGYLYAIATDSGGLADTPWPMFRHDPYHTGRYGYEGWK